MRRLAIGLAAVLLLAAACGDDDDTSSDTTGGAGDTSATTAGGGGGAEIHIAEFSFGDPITVPEGATVTVVNDDSVPHTWTADDGDFDSDTIDPGGSFEYTFDDETGTIGFHCEIHPSMTGSITVGEGSGDDGSDGATDTTAAGGGDVTTGPATIEAADQSTDGSHVGVDRVELPTDGFIAIHSDVDGAPGPVIGVSDLLPAGESTDVHVTLDPPLDATGTVWPMAHVDADGDGVYTFEPPDNSVDIPATTSAGDIAMVSVEVTVG